ALGGGGLALVAAVLLVPAVPSAAAAQSITFTHEVTVDPNRTNGEPDIAISDSGRPAYISGPEGCSAATSLAAKGDQRGAHCGRGAAADKLYMVYDTGETPPGQDAALRSTDGGHTWASACNLCVAGSGVGTRPGPVVINRATGTLYEWMGTSGGFEVNIS